MCAFALAAHEPLPLKATRAHFDSAVLNSVAQYFPSAAYLQQVLTRMVAALTAKVHTAHTDDSNETTAPDAALYGPMTTDRSSERPGTASAYGAVRPSSGVCGCGRLFIGDLRSLRHLEHFHISVAAHQLLGLWWTRPWPRIWSLWWRWRFW